MFIRRVKNRSGVASIQIIRKDNGRYRVVKTIGCATILYDIEKYEHLAKHELKKLTNKEQLSLFKSKTDKIVSGVLALCRIPM